MAVDYPRCCPALSTALHGVKRSSVLCSQVGPGSRSADIAASVFIRLGWTLQVQHAQAQQIWCRSIGTFMYTSCILTAYLLSYSGCWYIGYAMLGSVMSGNGCSAGACMGTTPLS